MLITIVSQGVFAMMLWFPYHRVHTTRRTVFLSLYANCLPCHSFRLSLSKRHSYDCTTKLRMPLFQWWTTSTGRHQDLSISLYHLVSVLYVEASDIGLYMKMVSEGKMQRYQRKKTRQMEGRIFSLWQQYCERNINATKLLQGCAFMDHQLSDLPSTKWRNY